MRKLVDILPSKEEEQKNNGSCKQDAEAEHILQSYKLRVLVVVGGVDLHT